MVPAPGGGFEEGRFMQVSGLVCMVVKVLVAVLVGGRVCVFEREGLAMLTCSRLRLPGAAKQPGSWMGGRPSGQSASVTPRLRPSPEIINGRSRSPATTAWWTVRWAHAGCRRCAATWRSQPPCSSEVALLLHRTGTAPVPLRRLAPAAAAAALGARGPRQGRRSPRMTSKRMRLLFSVVPAGLRLHSPPEAGPRRADARAADRRRHPSRRSLLRTFPAAFFCVRICRRSLL